MKKSKQRHRIKRRKPVLNEERVKVIAATLVLETVGRPLKFVGAHRDAIEGDEWTAIFETSDQEGRVYDGPTLVMVNDKTREARFFNDWSKRRWEARRLKEQLSGPN